MAQFETNWFLALALDPATDDWTLIEARIQAAKTEWNLLRQRGREAEADFYAGKLQAIIADLKDPARRGQLATEARTELARRRKQALEFVDSQIEILQASGGRVSADLVKTLGNKLKGKLTEQEIVDRLTQAGLAVAKPGDAKASPTKVARPALDKSRATDIRTKLQAAGADSLYALLGPQYSQGSSLASLQQAAGDQLKKLRAEGVRTPANTAREELLGVCQDLFATVEKKALYDRTLALDTLSVLDGSIESAGHDGIILPAELDVIIKQGRARRLQVDEICEYVEEYAARKKWKVHTGGPIAPLLPQCGFCASIAGSPQDKRCRACGEELVQPCPKCYHPKPTQDPACSKCGCHTGDGPIVQAFLKEARDAMAQGRFDAGLVACERILALWPGWEAAVALRKNLTDRHQERERDILHVDKLVQERKLFEARAALDAAGRKHGETGLGPTRTRITGAITRAEDLLAQAQRHQAAGRLDEALDLCSQALVACSDLEGALRLMVATPPNAPASLQVRLQPGLVRLSWPATGKAVVTYRVVRKDGSSPNAAEDGTSLAEVAGSAYDDSTASVGRPWYYAVYAVRAGVVSREAARSGPHLLVANVAAVEVLPGDGQVTLRWKPPAGCKQVEVWRDSGEAPARRGAGTRIPTTGETAVDSGLRNGSSYGYRVVAVFADPASPGCELSAAGHCETATPVAPPEAVCDLRAERAGDVIHFAWRSAGASIQIRQATKRPALETGSVVPVSRLDALGQLVASASTGTAHATVKAQGKLVFVPVSVAGGVAVVGVPCDVSSMDPVRDLKAASNGHTILLTWTWPAGVNEVRIRYATNGYPKDVHGGDAVTARVTRAEYDRHSGWSLRPGVRQPHWFSVYSHDSSSDLCSAPAHAFESLGQTTTLQYKLVVKRQLLTRKPVAAWLEIEAQEPTVLPELQVVGKARGLPLSETDGRVLTQVPASADARRSLRIDIPSMVIGSQLHVRLFFRRNEDAQLLRLLPHAGGNFVLP